MDVALSAHLYNPAHHRSVLRDSSSDLGHSPPPEIAHLPAQLVFRSRDNGAARHQLGMRHCSGFGLGSAMTLRFAVGSNEGPQSNSWKLWTHGDEAYLLQRGAIAPHQKFSFHKSGNCRWAKIQAGLSGAERVTFEWQRDAVAPAGSGQGTLLLSAAFPTNHLSAPRAMEKKPIRWIAPAAPGRAVMIELFVIYEDRQTVERSLAISGERRLIYFAKLRSGLCLCATASHFDCGPVETNMPAAPPGSGAIFGAMSFPDRDDLGTGRPIRLILMPQKHLPPTVWELGGYQTSTVEAISGP